MSGIERLGSFLEHVKLPISLRAASTVSGIPEDEIKGVLEGSDFTIINHQICLKGCDGLHGKKNGGNKKIPYKWVLPDM